MTEERSEPGNIMHSATSIQPDDFFSSNFDLELDLPEPLRPLDGISKNFYWTWNPDGAALFQDLDPALWKACEQNPRVFLKRISRLRSWQKATDKRYVGDVERFRAAQDAYLDEASVARGPISSDAPVAYFCAEYGVHNSLPNYSGGLGILAGDHLKSASDLNVPLVAVGLLYRYGYFRQQIGHDGWQVERYNDVFESELALSPVVDAAGDRIQVMVHIRGHEVYAQAWLAKIGRISLYLLDTNVRDNGSIDRMITGHLYGGDTETRIVQEKILGIGGVRLLRKLGVTPSVFHLNEGHSAFLTLELAREHIEASPDDSFEDAVSAVRRQCVFTTHTPVDAGNDVFSPAQLEECFDNNFIRSLKLDQDEFNALGRTDPANENEFFGMTPLAIRMCRSANGVSRKHGEVSRELWHKMFPGLTDTGDVPITHVTNGVHPPTWIAAVFQKLFTDRIGENWRTLIRERAAWDAAIDTIPDEEIWHAHCTLKQIVVAFVRERTRSNETGKLETINEHRDTRNLLSPDVLTIGFARRVAAYKRWDLLLSDVGRLLRMVDDRDRPVQFIFAGKAHPQDRVAKEILRKLMSINNDSNWQNRAVFLEDYDQEVARFIVQGVDVWMNVPRRPLEASGTSGEKAAMNGVLNFSVLDGWWIEGYDGDNGFAIGENGSAHSPHEDDADAESLYSTLERQIIPAFYERDEFGLPRQWIAKMRCSIRTLTPDFSSDRMVNDYLEKIYLAA